MTTLEAPPVARAPSTSSTASIRYLPGLDGMRALAVVAVMVYHANPDWLPGGFLGVEVFFVLSGYLITLLLLHEHESNGRIDLGRFWLRRAKRLLPALFVLLFLVLVVTAAFRTAALGRLRGDLLAGLTYVSNWYQIWSAQGYAAAGEFAPLRHLWSLAVEEQFYLVWPLVMVALLRRRASWTPTLVAAWLVTIATLVTVGVGLLHHSGRIGACSATPEAYWSLGERCVSKADALYLSTITRSSGLLFGAALAFLWRPEALARGPVRRHGPLFDVLGVAGLATLGVLAWRLHFVTPSGADDVLFRGGFLFTDVATLVVIAAVAHPTARLGMALGLRPLRWVGTRSYGLYLYHWPIYQLIRKVAGNRLTVEQFVAAVALTVLIAELSFRFVEQPIRTGEWRYQLRRIWNQDEPTARLVLFSTAVVCLLVGTFSVVRLQQADAVASTIEAALVDGERDTVTIDELLDGTAGESLAAREVRVAASTTLVPTTTVATTTPPTTSPPATSPPTTAAATPAAAPTSAPAPATVPPTTAPVASTASPVPTAPVEAASAPAPATTAAPPAPAAAPVPAARVAKLAIGDSVMLGAAGALADRGWAVNAEVSRQMVDTVPLMQQLAAGGVFGDAVVIHLGTNGPISATSLDGVLAPVADVPRVVLVTVVADRAWTAANNDLIRSRAGGNVVLVDWAAAAPACPGDCFEDDGIHLRPEGRTYYADLITAAAG
ncbi:MAG: acyltransferase family protein [Ilumatobacteraceae bacterium]